MTAMPEACAPPNLAALNLELFNVSTMSMPSASTMSMPRAVRGPHEDVEASNSARTRYSIRKLKRPRMRDRAPLAFAALISLVAGVSSAQSPLRLDAGVATNAWTVSHQGQPLLRYVFNPRQAKPYVAEFSALGGRNILRDAPFDHLHHHGLMYAIKVNGLNFWEEVSGNGVERVVETSASVTGEDATLRQVIHWVAPADAFIANTTPVALLIEHRTLVLAVDAATHEAALEWKAEFEVGKKTNDVTLTGATYHGLGMRFRQDLDKLADHSYAGRKPDLTKSRQEVSSAPWASVSFAAPDQPATIALVPHPTNTRGDGAFFSMITAFPYLSATQGLDKEPLIYHSGDKFTLRYLVVLYPEIKTTEALEARARRWRESAP